MAEEATATTDDTATEVAEQPNAQEAEANPSQERTAESYQRELEKLRKENAKYRTERNDFRADAEKYREIQDAEKTELQRTQEALEAERANSKQYQVQLARTQALAKYGISEDNADLLGDDPEKFDANAQRLGELQAQAARRTAPPSDYPVEDLKPGASDRQSAPDFAYPSNWAVKGPFANK